MSSMSNFRRQPQRYRLATPPHSPGRSTTPREGFRAAVGDDFSRSSGASSPLQFHFGPAEASLLDVAESMQTVASGTLLPSWYREWPQQRSAAPARFAFTAWSRWTLTEVFVRISTQRLVSDRRLLEDWADTALLGFVLRGWHAEACNISGSGRAFQFLQRAIERAWASARSREVLRLGRSVFTAWRYAALLTTHAKIAAGWHTRAQQEHSCARSAVLGLIQSRMVQMLLAIVLHWRYVLLHGSSRQQKDEDRSRKHHALRSWAADSLQTSFYSRLLQIIMSSWRCTTCKARQSEQKVAVLQRYLATLEMGESIPTSLQLILQAWRSSAAASSWSIRFRGLSQKFAEWQSSVHGFVASFSLKTQDKEMLSLIFVSWRSATALGALDTRFQLVLGRASTVQSALRRSVILWAAEGNTNARVSIMLAAWRSEVSTSRSADRVQEMMVRRRTERCRWAAAFLAAACQQREMINLWLPFSSWKSSTAAALWHDRVASLSGHVTHQRVQLQKLGAFLAKPLDHTPQLLLVLLAWRREASLALARASLHAMGTKLTLEKKRAATFFLSHMVRDDISLPLVLFSWRNLATSSTMQGRATTLAGRLTRLHGSMAAWASKGHASTAKHAVFLAWKSMASQASWQMWAQSGVMTAQERNTNARHIMMSWSDRKCCRMQLHMVLTAWNEVVSKSEDLANWQEKQQSMLRKYIMTLGSSAINSSLLRHAFLAWTLEVVHASCERRVSIIAASTKDTGVNFRNAMMRWSCHKDSLAHLNLLLRAWRSSVTRPTAADSELDKMIQAQLKHKALLQRFVVLQCFDGDWLGTGRIALRAWLAHAEHESKMRASAALAKRCGATLRGAMTAWSQTNGMRLQLCLVLTEWAHLVARTSMMTRLHSFSQHQSKHQVGLQKFLMTFCRETEWYQVGRLAFHSWAAEVLARKSFNDMTTAVKGRCKSLRSSLLTWTEAAGSRLYVGRVLSAWHHLAYATSMRAHVQKLSQGDELRQGRLQKFLTILVDDTDAANALTLHFVPWKVLVLSQKRVRDVTSVVQERFSNLCGSMMMWAESRDSRLYVSRIFSAWRHVVLATSVQAQAEKMAAQEALRQGSLQRLLTTLVEGTDAANILALHFFSWREQATRALCTKEVDALRTAATARGAHLRGAVMEWSSGREASVQLMVILRTWQNASLTASLKANLDRMTQQQTKQQSSLQQFVLNLSAGTSDDSFLRVVFLSWRSDAAEVAAARRLSAATSRESKHRGALQNFVLTQAALGALREILPIAFTSWRGVVMTSQWEHRIGATSARSQTLKHRFLLSLDSDAETLKRLLLTNWLQAAGASRIRSEADRSIALQSALQAKFTAAWCGWRDRECLIGAFNSWRCLVTSSAVRLIRSHACIEKAMWMIRETSASLLQVVLREWSRSALKAKTVSAASQVRGSFDVAVDALFGEGGIVKCKEVLIFQSLCLWVWQATSLQERRRQAEQMANAAQSLLLHARARAVEVVERCMLQVPEGALVAAVLSDWRQLVEFNKEQRRAQLQVAAARGRLAGIATQAIAGRIRGEEAAAVQLAWRGWAAAAQAAAALSGARHKAFAAKQRAAALLLSEASRHWALAVLHGWLSLARSRLSRSQQLRAAEALLSKSQGQDASPRALVAVVLAMWHRFAYAEQRALACASAAALRRSADRLQVQCHCALARLFGKDDKALLAAFWSAWSRLLVVKVQCRRACGQLLGKEDLLSLMAAWSAWHRALHTKRAEAVDLRCRQGGVLLAESQDRFCLASCWQTWLDHINEKSRLAGVCLQLERDHDNHMQQLTVLMCQRDARSLASLMLSTWRKHVVFLRASQQLAFAEQGADALAVREKRMACRVAMGLEGERSTLRALVPLLAWRTHAVAARSAQHVQKQAAAAHREGRRTGMAQALGELLRRDASSLLQAALHDWHKLALKSRLRVRLQGVQGLAAGLLCRGDGQRSRLPFAMWRAVAKSGGARRRTPALAASFEKAVMCRLLPMIFSLWSGLLAMESYVAAAHRQTDDMWREEVASWQLRCQEFLDLASGRAHLAAAQMAAWRLVYSLLRVLLAWRMATTRQRASWREDRMRCWSLELLDHKHGRFGDRELLRDCAMSWRAMAKESAWAAQLLSSESKWRAAADQLDCRATLLVSRCLERFGMSAQAMLAPVFHAWRSLGVSRQQEHQAKQQEEHLDLALGRARVAAAQMAAWRLVYGLLRMMFAWRLAAMRHKVFRREDRVRCWSIELLHQKHGQSGDRQLLMDCTRSWQTMARESTLAAQLESSESKWRAAAEQSNARATLLASRCLERFGASAKAILVPVYQAWRSFQLARHHERVTQQAEKQKENYGILLLSLCGSGDGTAILSPVYNAWRSLHLSWQQKRLVEREKEKYYGVLLSGLCGAGDRTAMLAPVYHAWRSLHRDRRHERSARQQQERYCVLLSGLCGSGDRTAMLAPIYHAWRSQHLARQQERLAERQKDEYRLLLSGLCQTGHRKAMLAPVYYAWRSAHLARQHGRSAEHRKEEYAVLLLSLCGDGDRKAMLVPVYHAWRSLHLARQQQRVAEQQKEEYRFLLLGLCGKGDRMAVLVPVYHAWRSLLLARQHELFARQHKEQYRVLLLGLHARGDHMVALVSKALLLLWRDMLRQHQDDDAAMHLQSQVDRLQRENAVLQSGRQHRKNYALAVLEHSWSMEPFLAHGLEAKE
eukprot:TRINITY_DN44816_c0_g1_i3.p1 TRINITY_DN44816_c0_g1~~TRINITY_DN44816_c0_g1_i3.p1  ORF type:complete len:2697 (+),score=470.73 TRINITY_DN44816_c0_g1_i3:153-8243(+)